MTTHRNWAVPSGAAILILAIWRFIQRRNRAGFVFKSILTIAAMALSVTAWWGGHIVYNYGLGVASLPAVTGDGHDHEHADGAGHETPSAVTAPAHDDNDGHHDAEPVAAIVPHGHDNSDGHHNTPIAAVPKGHDNSDGHHDHDAMSEDDRAIRAIIADVEMGWEQGDGSPFRSHFKDYDGARYFESGGENKGLEDLVVNHVEPEKTSIPDLKLGLSNIQIHYQGANMAWAVGDSTVQGTIVKNGTVLDRTGKQTWIFEKIDGAWKIVHTHSSSRAAKK